MNGLMRSRQFLFSVVMGAQPDKQKKLSGMGSALESATLLRDKGIRRVLLVTTPGTLRRNTLDDLQKMLGEAGITPVVFSDVAPDPTTVHATHCAQTYQEGSCEAILAIGGGSVIDCAKIAGALAVNPGKTVADISGTMRVGRKIPYFIAVPTTAGTGSEATAGAVIADISDGIHFKHPINDLHLVPDVAILDPYLLLTLPPKITAHTGMDALSHAVEAYTNRFCQKKTSAVATRSVQTIFQNLTRSFDDGQNLELRLALLEASYDAGWAINRNFIGYVHAISHAIGGLYGLPHGYINAVIMPYVFRKYGKSAEKRLAELAFCASVAKHGASDAYNADAFIVAIEMLNVHFGIPNKLDALREEDFAKIAERAVSEGNPTYPVPQIWNEHDFIDLLGHIRCGA